MPLLSSSVAAPHRSMDLNLRSKSLLPGPGDIPASLGISGGSCMRHAARPGHTALLNNVEAQNGVIKK